MINESLDLEKFRNIVLETEINNRFFNCTLNEINVWQLIRFEVIGELQKKIFEEGDRHPNSFGKKTIYNAKKLLIKNFYSIKHNALLKKEVVDAVVIRHSRRIKVDDKYIDVNTAYLNNQVKDFPKNVEFIDINIDRNDIEKNNCLLLYPNIFIIINTLFAVMLNIRRISNVSKEIAKTLYDKFNVSLNIRKRMIIEMVKYYSYYKVAKKYYSIKKPKKMYIVVAYCNFGVVQAAKDLGIETIEIQHGIITKYHYGYDYPRNTIIPHLTDKLYVYGEYWRENANFAIRKENIIPIGNQYFEMQINKYMNIKKDKNSILFISSGPFGKKLSELACNLSKTNSDLKIYYKLHPSEYRVSKTIYPNLYDRDIVIVEDEINLYELLAKCEYIVCVTSTVVYESFAFKPKLLFLNDTRIDTIIDIIKRYNFPIINDVDDLLFNINNKRKWEEVKKEEYFKRIEVC